MSERPAITTIETGAGAAVHPDGSKLVMKRQVTRVSDIRDTTFGPIDFGYVHLGEWWDETIPASKLGWLARLRRWFL